MYYGRDCGDIIRDINTSMQLNEVESQCCVYLAGWDAGTDLPIPNDYNAGMFPNNEYVHIFGGDNNTLYKRNLKTGAAEIFYPLGGFAPRTQGFATAVHIDYTSEIKPPPTTKVYAFGGEVQVGNSNSKLNDLLVLDLSNIAAGWTKVPVTTKPNPKMSPILMRINEDTLLLLGGYGKAQRVENLHIINP
jgi:hypothetical protein